MKIPHKYTVMLREEPYKDSDGWWGSLKEGFICEATGCRTIHEDTVKEFMLVLRTCHKIVYFENGGKM